MQFQKKAHTRIALKSVTVGFKITYFCVISIRSMWPWLYNNNFLSVLYKLNGSTHIPSNVEPYPVTVAVAPTFGIELSVGSMTGRMVSETIKSHVLMRNIWKGFSYVSFILYHYNVILSKKTQEIPAVCSPYLYCLLALINWICKSVFRTFVFSILFYCLFEFTVTKLLNNNFTLNCHI